jgi:glutaredoxin-like protein NrdH
MSEPAILAHKSVTVYTKPNCGDCVETKALMVELGLEFDEVDISKDIVALKRLKAAGHRGAPVVETSDTSWFGFNESKIRNLVSTENFASDDSVWDF